MYFLLEKLEELYKVQEDEAMKAELEDLSCKFGLLLHSTGAKMKTNAVTEVSKAVSVRQYIVVCTRLMVYSHH